ncbi:MAG: hypothetical protein ACTSP4_04740 [Candidatus Hodarchaeales archaeon]
MRIRKGEAAKMAESLHKRDKPDKEFIVRICRLLKGQLRRQGHYPIICRENNGKMWYQIHIKKISRIYGNEHRNFRVCFISWDYHWILPRVHAVPIETLLTGLTEDNLDYSTGYPRIVFTLYSYGKLVSRPAWKTETFIAKYELSEEKIAAILDGHLLDN